MAVTNKKKQEQPVVIRRGEEGRPVVYANSSEIQSSVWDFRIKFGKMVSREELKLTVDHEATVYLSPSHAKALSVMLAAQIEKYESEHGPLPGTKPFYSTAGDSSESKPPS